jgi:hypothetical protein
MGTGESGMSARQRWRIPAHGRGFARIGAHPADAELEVNLVACNHRLASCH